MNSCLVEPAPLVDLTFHAHPQSVQPQSLGKRCRPIGRVPVPAPHCNKKRKYQPCLPVERPQHEANVSPEKKAMAKALCSFLRELKKEIGAMVGAITFAERQLSEANKSTTCICCQRPFESFEEKEQSVRMMAVGIQQAIATLERSSSTKKREKIMRMSRKLNIKLPIATANEPSHLKLGARMALRSLKQRTLSSQSCTLCSKHLSTAEVARVLSDTDKQIRNI